METQNEKLLSDALKVCAAAAEMANRLQKLIETREVTLPIFLKIFGPSSVVRMTTDAHYWMEQLGNYFNATDAVDEDDEARFDPIFEIARRSFPLDDQDRAANHPELPGISQEVGG